MFCRLLFACCYDYIPSSSPIAAVVKLKKFYPFVKFEYGAPVMIGVYANEVGAVALFVWNGLGLGNAPTLISLPHSNLSFPVELNGPYFEFPPAAATATATAATLVS